MPLPASDALTSHDNIAGQGDKAQQLLFPVLLYISPNFNDITIQQT